jgi:glycosyltransferase involved in cell wall biosynthesis
MPAMPVSRPGPAGGTTVLLGNVPFHSCQQRPQHLARLLARSRSVVYVNPNRSFLQRWLRPPVCLDQTPPAGLPVLESWGGMPLGRTVPLFHRLNCWLAWQNLRAFLSRRRQPLHAVIATFPDQWFLVRHLPDDVPVVYDVMDDFTLFVRPANRPRYEDWHRSLLERCVFASASSRELHARLTGAGWHARHLGNGIPANLVARCRQASPAQELARLPRPRLGYLGTVSHWMDFPALDALARAFPGGSVVLVGPRDVPVPPLPANVHFLPAVPEGAIPAVLRGFDLGLIPFIRHRAIDAVDPIKLYEYQAAGLPVVAADFAEMRRQGRHVHRYADAHQAVACARAALAERAGQAVVQARQDFASRHTWEDRAARLARWVDAARARAGRNVLALDPFSATLPSSRAA